MIPIHQLLNRIRWDERYRGARFDIGYYDRVDDAVHIVPLADLYFPGGDKQSFVLVGADGITHRIPLHRIRVVYRDGRRVWARPH